MPACLIDAKILARLSLLWSSLARLSLTGAAWLAFGNVSTAGCAAKPAVPTPSFNDDTPYLLADDDDLSTEHQRYLSLSIENSKRGTLLSERLAAEYLTRIEMALTRDDRLAAYKNFTKLLSMRRPGVAAPSWRAAGLPVLNRLRRTLALAGKDAETVAVLYALALIAPKPAPYIAEIKEIFHYADQLADAEFGLGSVGSRPIEILEQVIKITPFPTACSTLIGLYVKRQQMMVKLIGEGQLTVKAIGAHGEGVLDTSWHIARVAALANDFEAGRKALSTISRLGVDEAVKAALANLARVNVHPNDFIVLAEQFINEPPRQDRAAALATLDAGRQRFPNNRELDRRRGMVASQAGLLLPAITLLERGQPVQFNDRAAAAELAELYEFRISRLTARGRPNAAKKMLGRFKNLYARALAVWPDFRPDLANAYAAWGRGLLSLGRLDEASAALNISLTVRPTFEALEALGTRALSQGQFDIASHYFDAALSQPATDPNVRFNHNKLMRLAGQALQGTGDQNAALATYRRALARWAQMGQSDTYELQAPFAAEAWVEIGKLWWQLGQTDSAIAAFSAAQDTTPDDGSIYAIIVSFLIIHRHYDQALEAYHRALGAVRVSQKLKIYLSLWMLAEARRTDRPPDPFVSDFLHSRRGRLWPDDLARYASGRISLRTLELRANSPAKWTELNYYVAVLEPLVGPTSTPSKQHKQREQRKQRFCRVIKSHRILVFEYQLAQHWLAHGYIPSPSSSRGR